VLSFKKLQNRYSLSKNRLLFSLLSKHVKKKKRKLSIVATAYISHRRQTDNTPFIAAWNNKIRPGMKIVAVSRDLIKKHGLKNGVKVKIKGLKGHYIVKDKMNKRFRKRIDIYMGLNKKKSTKMGKKKGCSLLLKFSLVII